MKPTTMMAAVAAVSNLAILSMLVPPRIGVPHKWCARPTVTEPALSVSERAHGYHSAALQLVRANGAIGGVSAKESSARGVQKPRSATRSAVAAARGRAAERGRPEAGPQPFPAHVGKDGRGGVAAGGGHDPAT